MGLKGAGIAQLADPAFLGLGRRGVRPLPEHSQNSVHVHDAWLPICMCMFHNLPVDLRVYVVMHLKQVETCRFHLVPQVQCFDVL